MSPPASNTSSSKAPGWANILQRCNQWLMFDVGGGPRPFKLATIINIQKAGSLPFFALLIWFYSTRTEAATSATAWIYLALHGGYGINWLIKDLLFPDPKWQQRSTILACIFGSAGLALYWLAGWLIISGRTSMDYPLPAPVWFSLCILLCLLGCIIMTAADVQKFCTLKLRQGLITDGMFTWIRHPNYLGEMLVYGGFALLAWHWLPGLVLAFFWGTMFSTNMVMKEVSLARHPGWAAYRQRTWWLLPGVF